MSRAMLCIVLGLSLIGSMATPSETLPLYMLNPPLNGTYSNRLTTYLVNPLDTCRWGAPPVQPFWVFGKYS
jgi:hypothetical protein